MKKLLPILLALALLTGCGAQEQTLPDEKSKPAEEVTLPESTQT